MQTSRMEATRTIQNINSVNYLPVESGVPAVRVTCTYIIIIIIYHMFVDVTSGSNADN